MPLRTADAARRERVELTTPGEWVEVRQLSLAEARSLQRRLMNLAAGIGIEGSTPMFRERVMSSGDMLDFMTYAALEMGLTAWSFKESITAENIRNLEDEDLALVRAKFDELNPERSEADRKN